MIDLNTVRSQMSYDYHTGHFTYLQSAGCRKKGDLVGWLDSSGGVSYRITKMKNKKIRLHRLAFFYVTGRWPNQIDHVNGDGLDNRWCNLREVCGNENNKNTKLLKNNKSGVHGVRLKKGKWVAYISENRKQSSLGSYSDFFSAVCARKSAEVKMGFHPNHGRVK